MSLNRLKTQVVVFGEEKEERKLRQERFPKEGVMMGEEMLEEVDGYEYLGLWFMWDLSFKSHVLKLEQKVRKRTLVIKRMGVLLNRLQPWLARTVTDAMLGTLMSYGMCIWGQAT